VHIQKSSICRSRSNFRIKVASCLPLLNFKIRRWVKETSDLFVRKTCKTRIFNTKSETVKMFWICMTSVVLA